MYTYFIFGTLFWVVYIIITDLVTMAYSDIYISDTGNYATSKAIERDYLNEKYNDELIDDINDIYWFFSDMNYDYLL